jgi:hypothetical protein
MRPVRARRHIHQEAVTAMIERAERTFTADRARPPLSRVWALGRLSRGTAKLSAPTPLPVTVSVALQNVLNPQLNILKVSTLRKIL